MYLTTYSLTCLRQLLRPAFQHWAGRKADAALAELRRDLAAQRAARETYERAADEERCRLKRLEDELSSTIARARRNQIAIVVKRLTHGALSRAFIPWKEGAALQRMREQAMRRVLNRVDKRALSMAFAMWMRRISNEKEKEKQQEEEERKQRQREDREREEKERSKQTQAEIEEAIADAELRATETAARTALQDAERKAEEQREAQAKAEAARQERGGSLFYFCLPANKEWGCFSLELGDVGVLTNACSLSTWPTRYRSQEDPSADPWTVLEFCVLCMGRRGCASRSYSPCRRCC